jgi:hypothetical protein
VGLFRETLQKGMVQYSTVDLLVLTSLDQLLLTMQLFFSFFYKTS